MKEEKKIEIQKKRKSWTVKKVWIYVLKLIFFAEKRKWKLDEKKQIQNEKKGLYFKFSLKFLSQVFCN